VWLELVRPRYAKKSTNLSRQKDFRIRKKAIKALEDLSYLARTLNPDQHKQIFTSDSLSLFVEALMKYASRRAHEQREKDKEKRAIVYDKRLFKIGVILGNKFLTMASLLMGEKYRKDATIRILPSKERIDDLNTIYNALKMAEAKP